MNSKKLAAAGVHVYTGTGLVFALMGAFALLNGDVRQFLVALWLAGIVDSTDGMMAQRANVKAVLPDFDGRRLDDLIDYVTYVFLPSVGLVVFGVLPAGLKWLVLVPMLASAYGFSQEMAKTDESFVGFPSYWNVVFLYLYILAPPLEWTIGILVGLSLMVFVPIHYIYPSHTKWLKPVNLGSTAIYGMVIGMVCFFPEAGWAGSVTRVSLIYPVYYLVISLLYHRRVIRGQEKIT